MDWESAARRPSERLAIAEYIRTAPAGTLETDWLEWKTVYDLATGPGRLAVARQVIAFANRHPDRAAQHAEGLGYLVLGVEPGNAPGIGVFDAADLENWLTPYLGDKISWDPDYVHIEESAVLFITIEAPRWGDPIHMLRRGAEDLEGRHVPEATIWVRKSGKTERASVADMEMLEERARSGARSLSLSLHAKQEEFRAVSAEVLSEAWRDDVIDGLRRSYLEDVPSWADSTTLLGLGETRRPETYRHEVESWLERLRKRWQEHIAAGFVEEEGCPVDLVVVNDTDQVYESVQIELRLPLQRKWIFTSANEAQEFYSLPQPPPRWGKGRLIVPEIADVVPVDLPEIRAAENDGDPTLVRFSPILVRPRSRHELPRIHLAMPPALADQKIPCTWRATSRSTIGEFPGHLTLDVAEDPAQAETNVENSEQTAAP